MLATTLTWTITHLGQRSSLEAFLNSSVQRPPIFVSGYERSGTTLLGNVIDRHPSIAVFIESFFIPRYYFTQILFWPLRRDENYLRLAQCIVDEPASQRNELKLPGSRVLLDRERTLSSAIDTLFQEWARSRGKQRWADKSPGYISKMSILDRMYPDARFIHIIRDGRDVWLSVKKLGWQTDVVEVATDWAKTVASARSYGASMDSERYLEVQYERLVAFPEQEARRISDFLGEPYDPAMIEPDEGGPGNPALVGWPKVDQAIDAENSQKWKQQLDDAELTAFNFCARHLLMALGYETTPSECTRFKQVAIKLRQIRNRARRPFRLTRQATRFFVKAAKHRMA